MYLTFSIDKLIYYFYMIFIIKKGQCTVLLYIVYHFISFIDNLNLFDILKCFKIQYLMAYNHI